MYVYSFESFFLLIYNVYQKMLSANTVLNKFVFSLIHSIVSYLLVRFDFYDFCYSILFAHCPRVDFKPMGDGYG